MKKIIFLSCLLLLLPFSVLAADHPVNEAELAAYKELSQARTDALKESIQKDMQAQLAQIVAQDKRVDRQDKMLDSFSARISDLSMFLTVFGLVAGLLGYFTVSSRAKKEARIAAAEWIEKEGQKAIDAKLNEFDSHLTAQKNAATAKREIFEGTIEKLSADALMQITERLSQISTSQKSMDRTVQKEISPVQSKALSEHVKALKLKPEAEYDDQDWIARALDAYSKKYIALAAEYWIQAARHSKVSAINAARSLNIAGGLLGKMNRIEEEIVVLDELISHYGSTQDTEVRKYVVSALGSKGFALLLRAKEEWSNEAARIDNLQTAAALLAQIEKEANNKPITWGNQAYIAFLLGQQDVARSLLKKALQQGGKSLYEGELADLGIYPVPPDAEFRAILDEVWAEVKPKS